MRYSRDDEAGDADQLMQPAAMIKHTNGMKVIRARASFYGETCICDDK